MLKIEVLFPEVGNLYGDPGNIMYLKNCIPDAGIIYDSLVEEPAFVSDTPDLIYMGTMTESAQKLVINKLSGYRDRLIEMIDSGVHFLITGNALEIFGQRIEDTKGETIECLGIFNTFARRDMTQRFNSLYLGEYKNKKIVGYKSQFTHSYWEGEQGDCVFVTRRGPGLNPEIKEEGIRRNNFMGTYIIGPLLVLNPPFTKLLLKDLGEDAEKLFFEKEAMDAYEVRVKEYSDESRGFYY